jgi:NAD/NADP transhydrogenase beta subunit
VKLPSSVTPDQLKVAAIVAMGVLLVVMFVVMRIVQKMVLRVILAGILVAGGVGVYAQRHDLDACQQQVRQIAIKTTEERCTCTFVGMKVKVPGCAALLPGQHG